jgi:polysaccharide biosynthesis transport protein
MATKQLPVDLNVLRVIAYRMSWLLVVLTFLSFSFSSLITSSLINLYTASITIFVDPENVLGNIAQGVAVSTSLQDQLTTLQHLILNDQFLEPLVIQELSLRLDDVYVPPGRLKFMPRMLEYGEQLKNLVKRIFGLEVWYQTEEQKRTVQDEMMVATLKSNIRLQQSRGMLLIITYTGLDPTTSERVVKILANQCKELLLRTKSLETREAVRYIERQYQDANQKLADLERELASMRVEQFDKGPEAKIALLRQREDALDDQRSLEQELQLLIDKRNKLLNLKSARQTELRSDPKVVEELARTARSQDALELDNLKNRLSELRAVYTEAWPEIKLLKDEIASREQAIKSTVANDPQAEEKIFLADPIYNEYFRQESQLNTEETSLQERSRRVQDNLAVYEQRIKAMPEIEKSFAAIERDITLYETLQRDLAQRRETARATMDLEQTRGENRIRVINQSFPTKPSGPSSILIMMALCLIGPAAGGGMIFLLYYLNNSVKNTEDVQKEYNLPVIATIPRTNFKKALRHHKKLLKKHQRTELPAPDGNEPGMEQDLGATEVSLYNTVMKRLQIPRRSKSSNELFMVTMLTNPESEAAEEYRRLCFNIEMGIRESLTGSCKTLMVASALPKEGKTITAVNLATTLARNHRVLLIDANLRSPSLHHIFGIANATGVSDLILHQQTPNLYVPENSPNLSILLSGLSLNSPADLLGSKPMNAFIDSVKNSRDFEYAVIDVPAVVGIPDASIIAAKLSGVVWTIEEFRTSKDIVRTALTRITNPSILGVVLNKSEQRLIPKQYTKIWKEYQQGSAPKRPKKP